MMDEDYIKSITSHSFEYYPPKKHRKSQLNSKNKSILRTHKNNSSRIIYFVKSKLLNRKNKYFNLPNLITLTRLVLVPVMVTFLLIKLPQSKLIAAIIFSIAALTDHLDGYFARKYSLITKFGKFMDPLVDKILIASALVALVEQKVVPSWIAIVIISRELIITGFRTIAASEGVVIAASKLGKFKTVSQIVAIIILLLEKKSLLGTIFIWISMFSTVISGIDYLVKNWERVFNEY